MKKIAINSVSKRCTIALAALLTLYSCQKSDLSLPPAAPELAGDWRRSDLMIVNSIGQKPKHFNEVPHLDDLRLVMSPDGTLTDGKSATGTWSIAKDQLLIKFRGEEDLAVKVSVTDNRVMLFEQNFREKDGGSGTLYYAFAK